MKSSEYLLRKKSMKEVDILHIVLPDIPASDSKELEEGVIVDLDDKEHFVELEILNTSERLGLEAKNHAPRKNSLRRKNRSCRM